MTHDHIDTIAQALESIVTQKTGFPFELIVHDDASQDGTADVVRDFAARYPDIVVPVSRPKTNTTSAISSTRICARL